MNERLEGLEKRRSAGQAGVQKKSGEKDTSATEAGAEKISQTEQQYQWPPSLP